MAGACVVSFVVACGSGSSEPQTGSGGSAGASGTTNGSGGSSGSGGSAPTGGATPSGGATQAGGSTHSGGAAGDGGSSGTGGSNGTGGTGGMPPTVMDCTQSQDFCISASGVRHGKPFACHSIDATDVSKVLVGTAKWAINCTVPA